ncbi:ribosome-associated translation inhibitor RaiA [Gordonia sp. PDNC005]|uniref:ribosome hibernation-promoting factor, HPF/YfiA family n=1 Tax=unclassified Gordonia (in: high G+C Gram-positive bacteria) TaxID=2657482 RepID=UPI001963494E|nr:ribosome-associated translation inhibitor RaiA [Gordonia sp. PDNC005]QRY61440.1 ribosome-associated translation inhibitor RaiA [Gordonia sp. PDNC005]
MTVVHRKGQREPKGPEPQSREELAAAFTPPANSTDAGELAEPRADVSWNGRNVEIPDHFRSYLGDKLSRLEHFDDSIYRFDVVLFHEPNRRQAKQSQVVEVTGIGRGPIVRAQGSGENFYAATELAFDKLHKRLRRSKRRKQVRKDGQRRATSVAEATADALPPLPEVTKVNGVDPWDDGLDGHQPGQVVRVKDHPAVPMSVDDALYEMELVGHDFFLFHDSETDKASVVYRRHAFDYGLIRLA